MVVIDTPIWIWWVNGHTDLTPAFAEVLKRNEVDGIGVPAWTCWEIAKLVERKRLLLQMPVDDWMRAALAYPGVVLLPLSPAISIESTRLPPPFHGDPADQVIVATSRVLNAPLLTADKQIRRYPHVQLAI